MHRPLPEMTLVTLLRQCYRSPRCLSAASPSRQRLFTTSALSYSIRRLRTEQLPSHNTSSTREFTTTSSRSNAPPTNIAILGGGVTGLTAAFTISREQPNAKITIYESSDRVGGWLRSKNVDVDNGKIIFEQGPRTLRPHTNAGMMTLQLIKELGLANALIMTPKTSPAARNRYIYYPNHLVKMPGPGQDFYEVAWGMLTEPVFKGMVSALWNERKMPQRPSSLEDESIGHFLERRLGNEHIADNIVSAVLHGIYAGDVYKLSAKSLMPMQWEMEGMYGSLTAGMAIALQKGSMLANMREAELERGLLGAPGTMAQWEEMQSASVYTFEHGMETLAHGLEAKLMANSNVDFKLDTKVEKMRYDEKSGGVTISTPDNLTPMVYSHVISTIPPKSLHQALPPATVPGPHPLALIPSTTVMVVNLYYSTPNLLPEQGFGYLIPRSVPFAQNPEFALGVIFDSDATPGVDTPNTPGEPMGTKITVMLGGHYWDGWGAAELPSLEEGAFMAQRVARRHLKIGEKPEKAMVSLQENCIPQYTVGHEQRLRELDGVLRREFKGKVSVAGAWVAGVGLNDCVRGGREAARMVMDDGRGTGLERVIEKKMWVWKSLRGGPTERATKEDDWK